MAKSKSILSLHSHDSITASDTLAHVCCVPHTAAIVAVNGNLRIVLLENCPFEMLNLCISCAFRFCYIDRPQSDIHYGVCSRTCVWLRNVGLYAVLIIIKLVRFSLSLAWNTSRLYKQQTAIVFSEKDINVTHVYRFCGPQILWVWLKR